MKRIILISLIIFMFTIEAYSQGSSGKVTYEAVLLKQKEFNLDTIKYSKKAKSIIKKLLHNKSLIKYTLEFNGYKSLFKQNKQLQIKKNTLLQVFIGKGSFYYDRKNNHLINKKNSYGETFLISYPKTEWKITNETKKINGYLCGKAITTIVENSRVKQTSTIVAWFAYNLPFNFGPKQFLGLPGLVLELDYIGKYKLRATKIELNSKEKIKIELPKKGIKLSLEEYQKKLEELFVKRRIRSQN